MDYSSYPPYNQFESPESDLYKDPMFNPVAQYEQAYTYYKYLCMQMEYKIKCKEYEKLCTPTGSPMRERVEEKR
jgi:hypothetical protein